MKSFKEKFPSLQPHWEECAMKANDNLYEHKSYCQCQIQEHCLDKEVVRKALESLKWDFSDEGHTENIVVWDRIEKLIERLGL